MAIPGILQQIARSSPMMGQIKQMYSMVRMAQDPMTVLNQLANTNPQVKQVIDMVNASGKDPMALFYSLAEQNGIDPQEILNGLK